MALYEVVRAPDPPGSVLRACPGQLLDTERPGHTALVTIFSAVLRPYIEPRKARR